MIRPIPTRRPKLLMITFDLNHPLSGDVRYRRVDAMLTAVGAMMKPFKQTRFVVTHSTARAVRASIRAIIGRRGNIGVMRISRRSAVEIADPGIRASMLSALSHTGSP